MRSILIAATAAICLATPSQAAETVFLQLTANGSQIEGDVTERGFEDTIEVFSMSLGGQTPQTSGTGRARTKVIYPPITFTVMSNQSMPMIFQAFARSERTEGTFSLIGLEQDGVVAEQQRITVQNGRITSVEIVSDAMGPMPRMVEVKMEWAQMTITDLASGNEVEIDRASGR